MLGMDPLYFYTDVAGEQSYATAIGQSPKLNHPQTLEHELLVQNHFQSQLLSPIHRNHHQRRDSFFPCSPSSASTSGGPSPYQAVVQPYLSDTKMAQRGQMSHPMAMGRSKSQQSLNSPEQTQHHQHRASLGHGSEFGASSMSRTSTQQSSNPAAYQTWLTAPRPNIISPPAELTGYASWDTEYALPMSAATVSHYGPRPNTSNRANLSHTQSSSGGDHMAEIGSISETFHQARNRSGTLGDSTFSEIPYLHDQTSLRPRPRTQSFPQHVFYNNDLLRHSPPHITTIQTASLSPLLPTPRKRRRPSTLSPTSPSDPVVGHVTAAGKFRCSDTTCADLSFGRQADFRRHYEHAHAAKKMEYFCTVDGCARSQRPAGGGRSKGRSFGSREDKMREHVRTVHEKGVGKRRKVDEEDGESEGWVEEM